MPNPILDAARQRLLAITAERAALDREERELRAMVAAAEGAASVPVEPWPALPFVPTIEPFVPAPIYPWPVWQPGPFWYVDPRPSITCGDGWTSTGTTIYVGDVNPSAGSVIASGSLTFDPNAAPSMLADGWRACGVSDTTGGPYYVKGPDLSHVTLS